MRAFGALYHLEGRILFAPPPELPYLLQPSTISENTARRLSKTLEKSVGTGRIEVALARCDSPPTNGSWRRGASVKERWRQPHQVAAAPKESLGQRQRRPGRNSVSAGRVEFTRASATTTPSREQCRSPWTNGSRPPPTREARPLEQRQRRPR